MAFENITLTQVAAFIAFVVALYGGVKYLKKELKDALSEMLKEEFESVDQKLDSDNRRIKDLEDQNKFIYKAISLLLQDDLAILEHLRTDNAGLPDTKIGDNMEKDVPYIVYESEAARHERTVKRLITALLIAILLIVGSNLAWLYVWNQYDITTETISIDNSDEGNANYLEAGINGEIINEQQHKGKTQDSN